MSHAPTRGDPLTDDLVAAARRNLRATGAHLVSAPDLSHHLGVDAGAWTRFGAHWDDLVPDGYAAELGTRRMRRYGHFGYRAADGRVERLAHGAFVQPEDSNPLYVDRDRHFEPLTEQFAADTLLGAVIGVLGGVATALADMPDWNVKVTPFRVVATGDGAGDPTPEGMHRDGVTLVTSLLIARRNAAGGESTVTTADGAPLLTTTLADPGTLLLGDDRRTLHGVSPIRPAAAGVPAHRDVLVVTFAAPEAVT
jgi:hypothetical protein